MELRYALAIVTGAGDGLGRELAVALSRRGAAVLAVDPDLGAAEETVVLVRRARVTGWAHQGGTDDETDVRLLAARALDLGGADVLVDAGPERPPTCSRPSCARRSTCVAAYAGTPAASYGSGGTCPRRRAPRTRVDGSSTH